MHRPTRGDGPRRHGAGVRQIPDVGPSVLDARVYTDERRYELERERVLRRSWLIAGRSAEVPEPGDHLLYEGHGETVVIVRQPDGSAAAFHNVCQHRGARIVSASGCGATRFTCPWHGWVYGSDGALRGVPDRQDFAPAQLEGLRAPPVAVEEWAGWIWIFLTPEEAIPLRDWLGPLGPELEAYRMEEMFVAEKCVFEVPCNYKAVVDGFNEMYHVAELHKVPADGVKAGRETSYAVFGRNSMMVVPLSPAELDTLRETGDHPATVTCHYVVFPTAVFNNLPTHLQLFHPVPTGPHTTRFECWELQYADGDERYRKQVARHWEMLKHVVGQDLFAFGELAKTRESMAYRANRFSDRECKPTAYHEEMARMVGEGAPVRVPKG